MDCPVCKEPMIIVEYADVEVDYCVSCRGVWLDEGELELLFDGDDAAVAALLTGAGADVVEGERRCPACGRKMLKESTAGDAPVVYDRCRRGDGLWFDCGELAAVLEAGHLAAGGGRVPEFLREIFRDSPPGPRPKA